MRIILKITDGDNVLGSWTLDGSEVLKAIVSNWMKQNKLILLKRKKSK